MDLYTKHLVKTTRPLCRRPYRPRSRIRRLSAVESTQSLDVVFMKKALEEAKCAFKEGEVPIGAVIVYENEIISSHHNQIEALTDSTAHAELLCIQQASQILKNWRLHGCSMFVTLEPCPMCAGAILQSRLDRVVYGARSPLLGSFGSWVDLANHKTHPFHPDLEVAGGVCKEESADLLRLFYKQRRMKHPRN